MTRASLLHILDHVSAISDPEIRELEQLAAAFPYCQTAHILLAKAAHDQGSMLASQRLRRAATYAADRQLLRKLIELPAPTVAALPAPAPEIEPASAEVAELSSVTEPTSSPELIVAAAPGFAGEADSEAFAPVYSVENPAVSSEPAETEESAVVATAESTTPELVEAEPAAVDTVEVPEPVTDSRVLAADLPAAEPVDAPQEGRVEAEAETLTHVAADQADLEQPQSTPQEVPTPEAELPSTSAELEDSGSAEAVQPEPEVTEASIEAEVANSITDQEVISESKTDSEQPEVEPALLAETQAEPATAEVETPAEDDDLLPPMAPPIRVPEAAGSSRFEFGLGLGLPEPTTEVVYELPDLDEETEASTVAEASPAGFRGDELLAYALGGGGSRMGYCLQPTDETTFPLPLTEFFPPDALLHEQAPRYQPAPPPAPSPFDLINKFLRNQPRLRTPAALPASAEEQADLSVRSTQVVPEIASESLAKIMVRQGKIHKAIEIYERLMMRQPEKKAYFAEQIQQLKSTE